jgi:hypothetical protein
MTHNIYAIARPANSTPQESEIEFSIDSPEDDGLGPMRGLVWSVVFEAGICIAAIVGWSLWLGVR